MKNKKDRLPKIFCVEVNCESHARILISKLDALGYTLKYSYELEVPGKTFLLVGDLSGFVSYAESSVVIFSSRNHRKSWVWLENGIDSIPSSTILKL